jgi:hypothetical protein
MTSPRLAECEARQASASLFPGVEDTRRPARVSTFWVESAPSPQGSSKIPKSESLVAESADRPIFLVSPLIIFIYYYITPGRVKRGVQQGECNR